MPPTSPSFRQCQRRCRCCFNSSCTTPTGIGEGQYVSAPLPGYLIQAPQPVDLKTLLHTDTDSWYNFKGSDQSKKVGDLSGGERNRLQLARVLKQSGNLLLLDEPTNDLDVTTLR